MLDKMIFLFNRPEMIAYGWPFVANTAATYAHMSNTAATYTHRSHTLLSRVR